MKCRKAMVVLEVVLAVSMLSLVFGEDWPQWRGSDRTGLSSEKGLLKKWPEAGPALLWSFDSLGAGYSSVAVVGDSIYATGMIDAEGCIFSIALDGKLRWKKKYGPEWAKQYPGVRSTPTVHQGRIYIMSGRGRVVCLDAETGNEKWAVDTITQFGGKILRFGIAESIIIDGNNVICTAGGPDATLIALDKMTGKTVWQTKGLSHESAYCSPILIKRGNTRLIVTMTKKAVVAVNAETGSVLWQHPYITKYGVHALTPLYQPDKGYLYFGSSSGGGGGMLKLAEDGKSVSLGWFDKKLTCHHGGAVLVDGYVYQSSAKKGSWSCLALAEGKVMYDVPGIGKGAITYADGMLYCYGMNASVCLVRADPKGYEIVSSFKISKGKKQHWAHPVIANGRLYIRHGASLMVFDVKNSGDTILN